MVMEVLTWEMSKKVQAVVLETKVGNGWLFYVKGVNG